MAYALFAPLWITAMRGHIGTKRLHLSYEFNGLNFLNGWNGLNYSIFIRFSVI
jgi:hypothetical protein